MKSCPTCQRTYADDSLSFCLEDGTALTPLAQSTQGETLLMDSTGQSTVESEPPPTAILDYSLPPPTIRSLDMDATARRHKPAATVPQQGRRTQVELQHQGAPAPVSGRRSTSAVVAITVTATILLLGLGGLGAWLLMRDKGDAAVTETTRAGNSSNIAGPGGNSTPGPGNANVSVTPNTNSDTLPTPSPTPTATPQATPTPTDAETVRREVTNALNGWTQTMRSADLEGHMAYYASTLHTYYLASNVNVGRVRANVARAFSKYSTFDVKLTNMKIEVDPSGTRAVATFDKTFTFSGATTYSGSGLNRFWFEKIGGRWLITGEKDLKTYYINSNQ
ncbi:MAG TPA: nuclear transport factor 2 family protein [Pyrinomonadaceae bacterium]